MIALAFLALAAFAAPETPIHEQIRASLAAGETALQASRWRASSEAYERVLQLMRSTHSRYLGCPTGGRGAAGAGTQPIFGRTVPPDYARVQQLACCAFGGARGARCGVPRA